MANIQGVDISNLQGAIDWPTVATSGIGLVWSKASEGTGYRDPTYTANRQGCIDTGIQHGSYHFARPDLQTMPLDEAHYFLQSVPDAGPNSLLCLDMEMPETDGPDLSAWALAFLEEVKARTGATPYLYSYPHYISTRLHDKRLATYPLWLASYSPSFVVPTPWTQVAMWQYTSKGSVPGITGVVDRDLCYAGAPGVKDAPMTPRVFPAVYLQRDPRWAAQLLGGIAGATVGEFGCYLASLAMLASYYGHTLTPPQLNSALAAQRIYVSGDLMPDDALHRLYPDLAVQQVYNWASVPADLGALKQVAADPALTAVIELDFDHDPSDGIASHFVVLAGCDSSRVLVFDPWWGDGTHADDMTTHYGPDPALTIQKAVVYRGKVPAPPVVHYKLSASQWLQQTPGTNNAVPGAPQVPKGAAIVCIGNPVTVTDAKSTSRWQRIGYGHQGKLWEGFVLSRFVKAV